MVNFPVYDSWSQRTEGAQRQQRREGVYTTFLKKPQNRKIVSVFGSMRGLDHHLGHTWPRSRTSDVRMLLASGAVGVLPLPAAAGMADAMHMASTCAVCSHPDDAVGYVIP